MTWYVGQLPYETIGIVGYQATKVSGNNQFTFRNGQNIGDIVGLGLVQKLDLRQRNDIALATGKQKCGSQMIKNYCFAGQTMHAAVVRSYCSLVFFVMKFEPSAISTRALKVYF